MKRARLFLYSFAIGAVPILMLTGCNTLVGVGMDLQDAGHAMSRATGSEPAYR